MKPGEPAMRTGLVADPFFKQHHTGLGHPESPQRYDAVWQKIQELGVRNRMLHLEAPSAPLAVIMNCHTLEYLRMVEQDVARGATYLSTGDTPLSGQSFEVARRAVGGVLEAVDAVMEGRINQAFCLIRPPGHHAARSRGMGFCILNNVAIAARYAQHKHALQKVLIVDWDVHHGNGTQDIFYEDASVFYFSTHQSPFYPGTGERYERGYGKGEGATLNCPFPAGAGREEILGAFENELLPAMDAFCPNVVLISAGFDSRVGDPLGRFRLTDEDFADLTRLMLELARRHAKGRLISVLEGGYNLQGLASAVAAHVHVLTTEAQDRAPEPQDR